MFNDNSTVCIKFISALEIVCIVSSKKRDPADFSTIKLDLAKEKTKENRINPFR